VASKPQKGKDQKRPRQFHRGIAQGRINEKRMKREVNPAYERADADRVQVAAMTADHRAQVRDHKEIMAGLEHVAPYVPSWDFSL
jgi:hypothetical protein